MTKNNIARRVALSLLLAGTAIPAAAQEAQTVTPPVLTPAPAPAAEAPTPAPAASPSITFAPQSPVVQAVPPPPAPPTEAAAAEAPEPRATPVRQRSTQVQQRNLRASSAPAPAAAVAPLPAPAPAPQAQAAPPPAATSPAAPRIPDAPPAQQEMSSGTAWALLAIPVVAILALGAWLLSRRRAREVSEETYYEPVEEGVVEPPLAAAPVVALESEATGRPWIDIGLRPLRAEDSLEVEVTVSNSGDAPAHDVRVSTWMLNGSESPEGEQALIEARSGAQIATVDVAAGDDQSVDTSMMLPADATPILVAEARYPLPQGGEGRIAATFEIDVTEGDVEARLHDVLERA